MDHLAEEIESVGQRDRDAIESQLVRVLLHLLKLTDDPVTRPRWGWRVTVADAREKVGRKARYGLQHHPADSLPVAYRYARRQGRAGHRSAAGTLPRGLSVDGGAGAG